MQLKRRVMDPRQRDDISEALAFNIPTDPDAMGEPRHYRFVPQYIYNYYPNGLRERVLGPHRRDLVGVTRFYPRCDPPVVVDFEPAHPDPWFREEKLQFFLERGIAYVPITLRDQLSTEAFVERVEAAKRLAIAARTEAAELKSLASVGQDVESWLQDPTLTADIDQEVLEVLQRENEARGKPLTGGARTRHLAHVKTRIIMQLREDLKRGRLMDPFQRHRQSAPPPQ